MTEFMKPSKTKDTEAVCLKEDCSVQNRYKCADERGYFLIDNLFSELTDNYQRTLARINLGIADEYALIWGNIKGNLINQEDLYNFVTSSIDTSIHNVLDSKADVYSPSFSGEPITTLPSTSDDSSRIASTKWVNNKIKEALNANNTTESLDELLNTKADKSSTYTKTEIDELLSGATAYSNEEPVLSKPSYTLEELGAEKAGAANIALENSKLYTDEVKSCLLDIIDSNITDIKKSLKITTSKLFSGNYRDLVDIPDLFNPTPHTHTISEITDFPNMWDWNNISNIPDSIVNINLYATKKDLDNKVDKIEGKDLSSNDFTLEYIQKINNLEQRIEALENKSTLLLE